MSAGAINFIALVTIGAVLFVLPMFGGEERKGLTLGLFAVGAVAGVALTISAFILMATWPDVLARLDVSDFEPTMNVGRTSDGRGIMFAIFFWPYEAAVLGVFVTCAFGWQLFRRAWALV